MENFLLSRYDFLDTSNFRESFLKLLRWLSRISRQKYPTINIFSNTRHHKTSKFLQDESDDDNNYARALTTTRPFFFQKNSRANKMEKSLL